MSVTPDLLGSKNVIIGKATVPYAVSGRGWMAGWALPGGDRTQNYEHAKRVAANINKMIADGPKDEI